MRSEKCKEEKFPICAEIFDTKGTGHVTALVQSRATKIKIKPFHFTLYLLLQPSFMCWRLENPIL